MLRKFKISIDGKEYLVEMEEIGGSQTVQSAQPVQQSAPSENQTQPEPQNETKEQKDNKEQNESQQTEVSEAGSDAMQAPMPGTVLKILVNQGDSVQENQPVLVLEAMKMENEIVASQTGTVQGIHVAKGDVVNSGDALLTIN